jgi:hypothetical protein
MVRGILATSRVVIPSPQPIDLNLCTDLATLTKAIGYSLVMARLLLGEREVAAEMLRRLRPACLERGIKYRRDEAIDAVAAYFGMDSNHLRNWLNRAR